MIDFEFYYKNSIRYLLLNKLGYLTNLYSIPNISKLIFKFLLSHIENVNDIQSYNYLYLFKYFFGYKAFLTKQLNFFKEGK
jgi:hypothetical protein